MCLKIFHACADNEGRHSRKRGRPEEASAAAEGINAEDAAPQTKVSRTGRVIVPPALREEALTPAPAAHTGRSKGRVAADAGVADTAPEEAAQQMEAQQKGRRKGKKSARRIEWPPAGAEQLAAAQKVRLPSWPGMHPRRTIADSQSHEESEDVELHNANTQLCGCWTKSLHLTAGRDGWEEIEMSGMCRWSRLRGRVSLGGCLLCQ